MSKKSKILYIDTNVVLDYVADKDNNVIVLMESVKSRGWKLRISTFAWIELAEYRRNEIYLWKQLSERKSLNSIIKRIKNQKDNKKLSDYHFNQVEEWLNNIQNTLPNIDFIDIDKARNDNEISGWELASYLSIHSNLNAKDIIHLATAIAASINGECDYFITSDADLFNEAQKIVTNNKIKLKIIKPKDFALTFPPQKRSKKT